MTLSELKGHFNYCKVCKPTSQNSRKW